MNIIVTGGAGFIGSNFIYYMLKKHPSDRIICVDKLTYAGNLETLEAAMEKKNFKFIRADIADRQAVYRIFEQEKPDIVVNFAAESHVDRSIENPEIFLQTNVIGTSVLLDACRRYGIDRYHQVSTDEVYGDLPLDRPDLFFTEETNLKTSSPYSASKAGADLLVMAYHRTYKIPTTISRCSNNYGPYHFPEKLIPLMIINALSDKKLPVYGDGKNVRDWLYVEDHCRAIDLILQKGRVGEVYTSAATMSAPTSTWSRPSSRSSASPKTSSSTSPTARATTVATPSTRRRSTRSSAGSRRRSSRTASRRPSSGTSSTVTGGWVSSAATTRLTTSACTTSAPSWSMPRSDADECNKIVIRLKQKEGRANGQRGSFARPSSCISINL